MDENTVFPQPVGWERIQELNQNLRKWQEAAIALGHRKTRLLASSWQLWLPRRNKKRKPRMASVKMIDELKDSVVLNAADNRIRY